MGADVSESAYGQSGAGFASKMRIALKECSETLWWLELLEEGRLFGDSEMFDTAASIKRTLIASIKTATANAKKRGLKFIDHRLSTIDNFRLKGEIDARGSHFSI